MRNKRKVLILTIGLALITIIGSSYALLKSSSNGTNAYSMTVGNLQVDFLDESTNSLTLTNLYPMTDEEGLAESRELSFTIKNTGNINALYSIHIEETSTNPEFKNVIRYAVNKSNAGYGEVKYIDENNMLYIDKVGSISSLAEVNYKVKVWIGEEADATYMNKQFRAKIVVESIQRTDVEITFDKGNLLTGLEDTDWVTADGSRMRYKVENGDVTVEALQDDGFGFTSGRVYLEAGKRYILQANTNGIWGNSSDTVEILLCLNGSSAEGNYIEFHQNIVEFIPTQTGEYWLRLDVNQNGKTYSFSNIVVKERYDKNLLYGLEDTDWVTADSSYMKYKVENNLITVQALRDDGWGYTTGRVYLEAGKTYAFNCFTDAIYGGSILEDTSQTSLMLNGDISTYYSMDSNVNYEFTPTVTGVYWLRLDVNQEGKTHSFWNISIEEKNPTNEIYTKTVSYGDKYGELPALQGKDGYAFAGWGAVTNDDYIELEYIKSTGTQYIDTGVNPSNTINFELTTKFDINVRKDISKAISIFGCLNGDKKISLNWGESVGEQMIYFWKNRTYVAGNGVPITSFSTANYAVENKTVISEINDEWKVNGDVVGETGSNGTWSDETNTLTVFGINTLSGVKVAGENMYVYGLKIWDGETLLRDFIPAIQKSTGKAGLYDKVEKQFYENQGTGNFIVKGKLSSESVVENNENHKLLALWNKDNEAPTLSLEKITYKNIPFDNSWSLTNATVDKSGVLSTTGNTYSAVSDYLDVNGGFYYITFDGYTESIASSRAPNGGVIFTINYYNSSKNSTTDQNSATISIYAINAKLNKWNNELLWESTVNWKSRGRYGDNVKYITIKFYDSASYSVPPVKIRNLKLYGEKMPNDFYLINVDAIDNGEIALMKYAKGNQNASYFSSNGTVVTQNQIRVEENGIYTVYINDGAGHEAVQTIEITDIV